jgi:hypothetical protein
MNWKGHDKKQSWADLRYWPSVFMKRPGENYEEPQSRWLISGLILKTWIIQMQRRISTHPSMPCNNILMTSHNLTRNIYGSPYYICSLKNICRNIKGREFFETCTLSFFCCYSND